MSDCSRIEDPSPRAVRRFETLETGGTMELRHRRVRRQEPYFQVQLADYEGAGLVLRRILKSWDGLDSKTRVVSGSASLTVNKELRAGIAVPGRSLNAASGIRYQPIRYQPASPPPCCVRLRREGLPLQDGLSEVYDRNAGYWDSRLYRTVYHGAYIRLLRTLQREGALGRPKRVLDCGIGAGLLSEALLNIVDWDLDLNGVDRSSKLLAMAASKFNRRGVRARLAAGDICGLPYRDEEMELVLSGLVLEHIPQPVDAVREMARVLRRGRLLVLTATRRGAPDHYFRRKYRYRPYGTVALLDWMKEAGLTEVRGYHLSGIARLFARAYVGVRM